ncbi:MAG: hypothetical protein K2L42_04045 [Clostridia bacterium]|nr:hypothetical protein [Clostridia bacterium]
MRSAIYSLLYNKHGNIETINYSDEYYAVQKQYDECYEKLEAVLNDEQKRILDDLFLLSGGLQSEAESAYYEEGFKFAVKLLIDGLK